MTGLSTDGAIEGQTIVVAFYQIVFFSPNMSQISVPDELCSGSIFDE